MADNELAANVRGGALVGGGFGGIIGAVLGWILASALVAVPVIGPVVGQGVLSTALVAMVAGVAAGALLGALAGAFSHPAVRDYVPGAPAAESVPIAPLPISAVRNTGPISETLAVPSAASDVVPDATAIPLVTTTEVVDEPGGAVPVDGEAASEHQPGAGTPVLRVRRRRHVASPDPENQAEN